MNKIKNYIVTFLCLVALGLPDMMSAAARRTPTRRPASRRAAPRRPQVRRAPVRKSVAARRPTITRPTNIRSRATVARRAAVARSASRIVPARAARPAPVRRPTRQAVLSNTQSSLNAAPQTPAPVYMHNGRVVFMPVRPQKGADCAYHAIENAYRGYQELSYNFAAGELDIEALRGHIVERRQERKRQADERLAELRRQRGRADEPATTTPDPKEQEEAKKQQADMLRGDNLNDGEVEHLVAFLRLGRDAVTVVPSLANCISGLHDINDTVRGLTADGAVHGFIINNGGHWVAIVASRRNGLLHYRVMDSMNGQPINAVQALQRVLGDPDPMPEVTLQQRMQNMVQKGMAAVRRGATHVTNAVRNVSRKVGARAAALKAAMMNRFRRR